jgi:hypothetical protein
MHRQAVGKQSGPSAIRLAAKRGRCGPGASDDSNGGGALRFFHAAALLAYLKRHHGRVEASARVSGNSDVTRLRKGCRQIARNLHSLLSRSMTASNQWESGSGATNVSEQ